MLVCDVGAIVEPVFERQNIERLRGRPGPAGDVVALEILTLVQES